MTRVHTTRRGDRVVRYIDKGEPDWRPLVFFGGLGTSVLAFDLTEFARTTREQLHLRVISVERNGFGETPLDPSLGIEDAVEDVLFVLRERTVERFGVIAFSGGGPYAAALAAQVPGRLESLHLAAAAAGGLPVGELPRDPVEMWRYPPESPVHQIQGFEDAAFAEGRRALALGGAAALEHERQLLAGTPLPSLKRVTAPAYLYHGSDDEIVSPSHAEAWLQTLGGPVTLRFYEGEGHDVQYSHWEEILHDAAGP